MNKEVTGSILRGNNPEEINEFLDRIITQVEALVSDANKKNKELATMEKELVARDEKIHRLAMELAEVTRQLKRYEDIEDNLSKTIQIAKETSIKIQKSAHQEKEKLLEDAKKNADKIVNDALLRAEKTDMEANMLRRNIKLLKNKMKNVIDSQLDQE